MGDTTSPHVEADSARSQLEMITMLPVLYGNGLDTCFPCPPSLLTEVIRINHLRSVFRAVPDLTGAGTAVRKDKHAAALDVLRRIRTCPVEQWAAEASVGISNGEDAVGLRGWQAIASIYQCAVVIYCIASLLLDNAGPGTGDWFPGEEEYTAGQLEHQQALAKERDAYCWALLEGLRVVSKNTLLRKQVVWPLFVAGVYAEDEPTRRFIVDELRWISNALGTAAPMVAKGLLENRIWRLELWRGDWDRLFDQSYVFVL